MSGIVRNGVILAVYLFIIFSLYIFISSPFDDIMSSFEDIDGDYDAEVEAQSGFNRLVFDMMFAILALVPSIWFILWCFSREPDWGYYR